jgi:hypothetical protein
LASLVKSKPYRDGHRVFFDPWGLGANDALMLNAAVGELADDRALMLVGESAQVFGLRYAQLLGRLPRHAAIRLIHADVTDEQLAERPALVDDYFSAGRTIVLGPTGRDDPRAGIRGAHWQRRGDICRFSRLEPAATNAASFP